MNENVLIIISYVVMIIINLFTILKGINWVMKKIDSRIDERILLNENLDKKIDSRIDANPLLDDYSLTRYKIDELQPDVRQIKADIRNIELKLASLLDKKNGT